MRPLSLLLAAGLAACAAPDPGAPPAAPPETPPAPSAAFGARAWAAEARALGADTTTETAGFDDPRAPEMKVLADRLDAALGWRAACDTYWDEEAGRMVTDTTADDAHHFLRGTFHLVPFGDDEWLVPVTCDFGAYQGFYALAHLAGDRAALLTAPVIELDGTATGRRSGTFSTVVGVDPAARTFTTFALARGLGDCGERAVHRVGAGGAAEVVEVRARECGPTVPDVLPPPEAWPVVYPAR